MSTTELRSIMYLSRAETENPQFLPRALSGILATSRRFNQQNGVSGVLCYRKELYLQVLEGETAVLGSLYRKIRADNRHSDVKTIVDTPIRGRLFPSWGMQLSAHSNRRQLLDRYVGAHREHFEQVSEELKAGLGLFCSPIAVSPSFPAANDAHQFEFHLRSFPLVDTSEETAARQLDACARLSHRWVSIAQLSSDLPLPRKDVYGFLHSYCRQNVLEWRPLRRVSLAGSTRVQRGGTASRFYSRLRSLLAGAA